MDLVDALVSKKLLTKSDGVRIKEDAVASGTPLEALLIRAGIPAGDILAVKGEEYGIPTRSIEDPNKIPNEVLNYIPEESATHYGVVPLAVEDGALAVGIVDPDNIDAMDALSFISSKANLPYKVHLISYGDFEKILERYQGLASEAGRALTELETELSAEEQKIQKELDQMADTSSSGKAELADIKEDAPVTKLVATILRYAVEGGASDVHIEPLEDKVKVRFRVDGVLHTSLMLPVKVHQSMVARIKILSAMKLDERRKPQDGRFSATIGNRPIDFRVSTFPSYYGEKVVMRILDRERGFVALNDLGFSKEAFAAVRRAIDQPYGIILLSGPTGSGKTTTLYSMLSEMDREKKNVLSLEDPVEFNVEGVTQSQVRPEIGYTFATGLRTTLRQDPDVIMVGEIRDKETAQLAIQAALTGHLVLSTIHTNDAVGVIPRLVDMGVDPFLIAPTLRLAIAQRLVRKLCPGAGKPVPIEGSVKEMIQDEFRDLPEEYWKKKLEGKQLYEAEETAECPNGTRGRVAVFEVLEIDEEIERILLKSPNKGPLRDAARRKGMFTMKEDAIIKSTEKIVPFEEVNALGGAMLLDEEAPQVAEEKEGAGATVTEEKEQ